MPHNERIIPEERFTRKRFLALADRLLIPAIILLVGAGSFGLGRLSVLEKSPPRLIIHPPGDAKAQAEPAGWAEESPTALEGSSSPIGAPDGPKNFVASKNGTRYYPAGCPGAKRIAAANQLWFATAAAAAAAGFTPAAGCSK